MRSHFLRRMEHLFHNTYKNINFNVLKSYHYLQKKPCLNYEVLWIDCCSNSEISPFPTAHKGDVCVIDSSIYQNGETFFPSCKYQCTCRDGQMACVPRCNLDVMLPGPDCPFPRRVQVPGECCEKWVCDPQMEASALGGFAMAGELTFTLPLHLSFTSLSPQWETLRTLWEGECVCCGVVCVCCGVSVYTMVWQCPQC